MKWSQLSTKWKATAILIPWALPVGYAAYTTLIEGTTGGPNFIQAFQTRILATLRTQMAPAHIILRASRNCSPCLDAPTTPHQTAQPTQASRFTKPDLDGVNPATLNMDLMKKQT
jgi:hypothetical protein